MPLPIRTLLVGLVVLGAAAGCQSGAPKDGGRPSDAQVLCRLYGHYIQKNRGNPPQNAEALKAHLKKMSPAEFKSLGADPGNLDKLFISARDQKPFVFRNPAAYKQSPGERVVVFHEQEGSGGKRLVAYPTGRSEEVDAAKFKELVPESN